MAQLTIGFDSRDSATPDYVLNTTDPDELRQILKEHIDAVMGRYKNDVYAFDIVNERRCLVLSAYFPPI